MSPAGRNRGSGPQTATPLGIDLGTTHTVVARFGEALEVSPGAPEPFLLPSMLAFPPSGEMRVGWEARERRTIDPRHTLISTKRLIGARWGSRRAQHYAERYPTTLVDRGGVACLQTRAGAFDPVDVASTLLDHAIRRVALDSESVDAIITVPSSFNDEERAATLTAAQRTGLARARLIEEPVATAVAYLSRASLRYAAIYDLGGGTFDFAVVDCLRHPFTVVAHAGDPYLGGDDVDRELANCVAEQILRARRWDLADDPETFARLVATCESAKLTLSRGAERSELDLEQIDPAGPWGADATAWVQHDELASIASTLVRRSFVIVDHVLSEAGVFADEVDAIFLAGGSAALPGLADAVEKYFQKRPRRDIDPSHVVALGASHAASRPDLTPVLGSSTAVRAGDAPA